MLQMVDMFISGYPMLTMAILECVAFAWFYGTRPFRSSVFNSPLLNMAYSVYSLRMAPVG